MEVVNLWVLLVALSTIIVSGSDLPGNLVEPGRYCDPALYDQVIRPSTEALQQLYTEIETEKQIGAAVMFGIAARNMQRSLHALIEVPESETNKGAYKKKELNNILATKACLGLVASYLTCDEEQSVCVCRNSFPFNFILENGECHGLPGSICAVDKSYILPCTQGTICEKEGIKSMRFCGGVPEFKKAQLAARGELLFENTTLVPESDADLTLSSNNSNQSVKINLFESKPGSQAYIFSSNSSQVVNMSSYKLGVGHMPTSSPDSNMTTKINSFEFNERDPTTKSGEVQTMNTNSLGKQQDPSLTYSSRSGEAASTELDSGNNLKVKLDELSESLNSNWEKLKVALQKIEQLENTVQNITKKYDLERMSDELHRHRIILLGVPEEPNEDDYSLKARVETLVNSEDLMVQGVMCGKFQRLGLLRSDGRPRAVKINYCF